MWKRILSVAAAAQLGAAPAAAQSYGILTSAFAGGGATSDTGGIYTIGGTIGLASVVSLSTGGAYSVGAGFWNTMTFSCAAITLSPASLGNGTVGVQYAATLTQDGGTNPSAFAVTTGALPDGIALSNAGHLSGVPTDYGAFSVGVTATDANSCTGMRSYGLTIVAGFTDDPIVVGVTPVRAVHISQLRRRVDAVRARLNLPAATWTDPTLPAGASIVRAQHVLELRTALVQAYQAASLTTPAFTDPNLQPGQTTVRAVHITELRAAVIALENQTP